MTNYEKWNLIHRDVTSPQSYIDFSFYYLISAALQRRVWMNNNNPNEPGNLFPNSFVVLVGPASTGKSRIIIPTAHMLKYHRIDLSNGKIIEPTEESLTVDDYLFPVGPDSITYEQLLIRISKSVRRINNPDPSPKQGEPRVYGHSSMSIINDEMATLFKLDLKKMSDFLLKTYDCEDFRDETKTQGSVGLRKPCVSMLVGTTVESLEEIFNSKMLNNGFVSRLWLIYEMTPRFAKFRIPALDESQTLAKIEILEYLKKLAFCFGRVDFSEEANEYLTHWWEKEESQGVNRSNSNPKLDTYYGRKVIHLKKLCMALHFSEQTSSYEMSLEIAQRGIEIFKNVEKRMHYALMFGGRNPLAIIAKRIYNHIMIGRKGVTPNELLEHFSEDVREMELVEILRMLEATSKLVKRNGKYLIASWNRISDNVEMMSPSPNGDNKLITPTRGADLPALPLNTPLANGETINLESSQT